MKVPPAIRRFSPSLAAAGGLLLGLLLRSEPSGNEADPTANLRPEQSRPSDPSASPLASGPASAFLREIMGASAAGCETRALEFFENGGARKEIEMEALFRRWLAFESPDEILSKLNKLDGPMQTDWNAAFFHAWVALDEAAAMADTKYAQICPARALFAIAHADPAFASYFTHTSRSSSFGGKAAAALTKLARDRPEVASLIADSEVSAAMKTKGIAAVARGWAMSDPEAALAWVQSLDLDKPETHFAKVFAEWIKTDPSAANAARERLGLTKASLADNSIGNQALQAMTAPQAAANQINLALHRDPFMGVAGLYEELSAQDIDWEKPGYLGPAIDHDGWYGVDPAADAQAATQLPPGKTRDYIMAAICQNWAAHDHSAALQFADENGLASTYLDRLKNKPTEEMRQTVFASPEEHVALLFDPDAAPPDGMSRDQLNEVAKQWTEADPIAAAEWLITQDIPKWDEPGGPEASLLFSNTLGYYWARIDPLGASRWVEALPDGPNKSRAWSAIREHVTRYSPDLAFQLSAAWSDSSSREGLLTRQLETVVKTIGRPAAVELLNSPDLSPQERATLNENLNSADDGPAQ